MFTTKYMKNQPKAAKRRAKKYEDGGYVDADVQSDDDEIRAQAAAGRRTHSTSDYMKDFRIEHSYSDRRDGRSSPEQAIDKITAQGRKKSSDYYGKKDADTAATGGRK